MCLQETLHVTERGVNVPADWLKDCFDLSSSTRKSSGDTSLPVGECRGDSMCGRSELSSRRLSLRGNRQMAIGKGPDVERFY